MWKTSSCGAKFSSSLGYKVNIFKLIIRLISFRSIKDYRTAHIKFSQYVRRNSEKFLKPMNINVSASAAETLIEHIFVR